MRSPLRAVWVRGGDLFARRTVREGLLLLGAFLAVFYPLVLAHRRYGAAAPFKFFANDAFYYLNVAKRSYDVPFYTYDGAHPTNGFHPLWQWLLTGSLRVVGLERASDEQLLFVFGLCGMLTACGIAMLALVLARLTGSRALGLFGAVPGFYDLAMSRLTYSTVDNTESAPWSFANGVESGLSVFFWFGVLALLLFRPGAFERPRRLVAISCVLTLVTLSRLDDVFLLVAFLAMVAIATENRRETLRRVAMTAVVPTIGVGLYLAYNVSTCGVLMPVSGAAKLNAGALVDNAMAVWRTLVPTALWTGTYWFSWDAVAWRVMQLVVPMGVAFAYLLAVVAKGERSVEQRGAEDRGVRRALATLAAYVLLKGAYNFALVPLGHQGHWYFPLSIAVVNVLLSLGVARILRGCKPADLGIELGPRLRGRAVPALRALATVSLLGVVLILVVVVKQSSAAPLVEYVRMQRRTLAIGGCALVVGVGLAVFAEAAAAALERLAAHSRVLSLGGPAAVVALVFALASGSATVNQKIDGRYMDVAYAFWAARDEVDAHVARLGASGHIFEFDDGIMGYALRAPTMNAMGLAVDREASSAFRSRRCWDVAYERGFHVVSSVTYWSYLNEQRVGYVRPTSDAEILTALTGGDTMATLQECGMDRFAFSVLPPLQVGRFSVYFLAFEPK